MLTAQHQGKKYLYAVGASRIPQYPVGYIPGTIAPGAVNISGVCVWFTKVFVKRIYLDVKSSLSHGSMLIAEHPGYKYLIVAGVSPIHPRYDIFKRCN